MSNEHDKNDINNGIAATTGLRRRVIFPQQKQRQQQEQQQQQQQEDVKQQNDIISSKSHEHEHEHTQSVTSSTGASASTNSHPQQPAHTHTNTTPHTTPHTTTHINTQSSPLTTTYSPESTTGRILTYISHKLPLTSTKSGSALPGFLALLLLTKANYMLSPMRDAAALAVGVSHIPTLTLASTILALASSVPMGWLFEAPDPMRRGKSWRDKVGLTRGETQGTSLALFLRCYAICLIGYALSFKLLEWFDWTDGNDSNNDTIRSSENDNDMDGNGNGNGNVYNDTLFLYIQTETLWMNTIRITTKLLQKFGKVFYIAFFLVVHLMKLHSLSLIWGVTTEAMEYEEQAEERERKRRKIMKERNRGIIRGGMNNYGTNDNKNYTSNDMDNYEDDDDEDDDQSLQENKKSGSGKQSRTRLKRLAFVGFGGTLGGIIGSVIVSITAHTLRLSGLLIVAAILLLLSAELSTELGQIMLRHWEEEQNEKYHLMLSEDHNDHNAVHNSNAVHNTGIGHVNGNVHMNANGHSDCNENDKNDYISLGRQGSGGSSDHQQIGQTFSNSTITNSGDGGGNGNGLNHNNNNNNNTTNNEAGFDSSMKRVNSFGGMGMKRSASGISINSLNSMSNIIVNGAGPGMNTNTSIGKEIDTCMKKVASSGSMKRVASGNSIAMKRVASGNSIASIRRAMSSQNSLSAMDSNGNPTSLSSNTDASSTSIAMENVVHIQTTQEVVMDDNTFKQRLLRGITTILRSRLLMTIFTYNALYATTSTLLSFQRAELVANRSSTTNSMSSDAAFLAKINIISSVAVFFLQVSGLGAFIASGLGQRGTLSLMPVVRMFGVAMLVLWHLKAGGTPPNLTFFLVLDEFTKVINFAVAKPVRESLWRGLSNEARYEAKPIVDTLANRWGSGSAAFLMSLLDRMLHSGLGEELEDGTKTLFGFPPLLILCAIAAAWWAFVSADLGSIRHRIDLELKKQQ